MENASSPSLPDSDQHMNISPQSPTIRQRPNPSRSSPHQRPHHPNSRFPPNRRENRFHNKSYPNRNHYNPGFNSWNANRGFAPRPLHLNPPPPPPVPDYRIPFDSYFQDVYGPLYYAPDVQYWDTMNGVPMYPQPLAMYVSQDVVDCCNALLAQIEYYFSDANLMTDSYLKSKMDEQGWVSVHLIAGFRKVKCLTQDTNLILEALRPSTIVEVQGNKIRKRGDWMVWVSPCGSSSPTHPTQNTLVNKMQSLQLDEGSGTQTMASKLQPCGTLPDTISTVSSSEPHQRPLH